MNKHVPPTRWELADGARLGYADRFGELIDSGQDIDGEARLADALLPRAARVLDAGTGMGRVGASLMARGHTVLATDPDADLLAIAGDRYPGLRTLKRDNLELDPAEIGTFDLVVCVGNVMTLMAEGTEVAGLTALRGVLAPGGRILVGFHLRGGPTHARTYPFAEFEADAATAGLVVRQRFGTYELHPPNDDYVVAILEDDR